MNQLDMFSHQAELPMAMPAPVAGLLAEPAPAAAPEPVPAAVLRRLGGMPAGVYRKWERAGTDEVLEAMLAVAQARPGEWLTSSAFDAVLEQFDISSQRMRPLLKLVLAGKLDQRFFYFGARKPGPDYLGFRYEWRFHPPIAENPPTPSN